MRGVLRNLGPAFGLGLLTAAGQLPLGAWYVALPALAVVIARVAGAEGARRAAAQADITLLEADCRLLAANPLETLWAMLDSLRREALFHGACVCFHAAQAFADRPQPGADTAAWEKRFFHLCAAPLLENGIPVCVCTDTPA